MLSFVMGNDAHAHWPRFVDETAKLDGIRNENFWETFYEFAELYEPT
jgi:hypothetical protein